MHTDLILFLAAAMFSPGPNIIMLTNSGARFGLRATIPHLVGVVVGVGIIGASSGLGIGALIVAMPKLRFALQVASAVWILVLAFRLLSAKSGEQNTKAARPMGFWQAVAFQWVNPKIWVIALAASAGYLAGASPIAEALKMGIAFSSVNFFVCAFWTYCGVLLTQLLKSERSWNSFRIIMATFLALSAGLVFW